jgi:hypothetical protein
LFQRAQVSKSWPACTRREIRGSGGGGLTAKFRLHPTAARFARYCHLSQTKAGLGEVKRGDVIGYLGTTGWKPGPGFEHVHFSVTVRGTLVDPVKLIVGCFDSKRVYPTDGPILTYPVKC